MSAADPPPISLGSSGDIDMYPGPTTRAIDGIREAADAFGQSWQGRSNTIHAEEVAAKTGFDDVSVNFRTAYNNIEPDVTAAVAAFAPKIVGAADVGKGIVAQYLEAFQQATDVLRPR